MRILTLFSQLSHCSPRPCRVPTEVSSGLLRHLMNVYAASPHFYTVAPAPQSSPVAHICAVLPVFALLTRAAAHVGLMFFLGAAHCSLEGHLQEQCGPSPGARAHGLSPLRTSVSQHSRADHHCQANVLLRRASSRFWTSSLSRLPAPTVVAASGPTVLVHHFIAISCYGAATPVAKCFSSASIAYRTIPCSLVDRICANCELRRTSSSSVHCIGSLVGYVALAPAACHAVATPAIMLHLLHLLCTSCLCIPGYDRQERRDFVGNLDPAAAFQSPSKPTACLPVVS